MEHPANFWLCPGRFCRRRRGWPDTAILNRPEGPPHALQLRRYATAIKAAQLVRRGLQRAGPVTAKPAAICDVHAAEVPGMALLRSPARPRARRILTSQKQLPRRWQRPFSSRLRGGTDPPMRMCSTICRRTTSSSALARGSVQRRQRSRRAAGRSGGESGRGGGAADWGTVTKSLPSPYNARAGAEGAMSRYKRIIGDTLRSHTRPAQEVEIRIAVTVLNRMLDLGCPDSVRAA